MPSDRLRITQSLLSAWQYVYRTDDGYDKFLQVLNRIPSEPTQAMLDGTRFESCVNRLLDGISIDEGCEWPVPVRQLARYLNGSQQQVVLFREMDIAGQPVLLHGIMDFLRAGICYDTKFSKTYELGKYFHSPQHSMYFALAPEVREFQYLICDGTYLYRETYHPYETEPIEVKIKQFMRFLKETGNWDTFCDKWKSKGYANYETYFG